MLCTFSVPYFGIDVITHLNLNLTYCWFTLWGSCYIKYSFFASFFYINISTLAKLFNSNYVQFMKTSANTEFDKTKVKYCIRCITSSLSVHSFHYVFFDPQWSTTCWIVLPDSYQRLCTFWISVLFTYSRFCSRGDTGSCYKLTIDANSYYVKYTSYD
jgi:hypothetical protein